MPRCVRCGYPKAISAEKHCEPYDPNKIILAASPQHPSNTAEFKNFLNDASYIKTGLPPHPRASSSDATTKKK